MVYWSSRSGGNLAATFLAIFSELHFFQKNILQWMQSTRYLKRMGMIADVLIGFLRHLHDHVNALKTRHVFSAEFKSVKNLYFWELFSLRARSKRRLSYPFVSGISWIAFTVKYFSEKSVIQKIWPKMWPPNFHLISNFNVCWYARVITWCIFKPVTHQKLSVKLHLAVESFSAK